MKMAKASEADLDMAMELCGAIDVLGQRFLPSMPEAIEELGADDDREPFDLDDDAQCGRALRHLLDIADRASLMRVVWGCAVMLDPRNELVDPDADTIEHHPRVAALEAENAALRAAMDRLELEASSAEQYAMRMLWDDQPLEEKNHYLAVALGAGGKEGSDAST